MIHSLMKNSRGELESESIFDPDSFFMRYFWSFFCPESMTTRGQDKSTQTIVAREKENQIQAARGQDKSTQTTTELFVIVDYV